MAQSKTKKSKPKIKKNDSDEGDGKVFSAIVAIVLIILIVIIPGMIALFIDGCSIDTSGCTPPGVTGICSLIAISLGVEGIICLIKKARGVLLHWWDLLWFFVAVIVIYLYRISK